MRGRAELKGVFCGAAPRASSARCGIADDEQQPGAGRGERFGHLGLGSDERAELGDLLGVGEHAVDGQQPAGPQRAE